MPHKERARGDNISKSGRRKAAVAADSTCRSQSRGPEEPVVQRIRDKRITKLSTGILEESKYVKRQKEKPNKNYAKKKNGKKVKCIAMQG